MRKQICCYFLQCLQCAKILYFLSSKRVLLLSISCRNHNLFRETQSKMDSCLNFWTLSDFIFLAACICFIVCLWWGNTLMSVLCQFYHFTEGKFHILSHKKISEIFLWVSCQLGIISILSLSVVLPAYYSEFLFQEK